MRRVIECNACGHLIQGDDDDELLARMREHEQRDHPSREWDESAARDTIAAQAYNASDS
jgi:predicted small metal-binding protein